MTRALIVLSLAGLLLLATAAVIIGVQPAESTPGNWMASALPQVESSGRNYRAAIARLHSYFVDHCGPPPNARSCDWGVYHEYSATSHEAMVVGATTSETMSLVFVFETLYNALFHDSTGMEEALNYIRNYMMPHDGQETPKLPDSQHSGAYQPCLVHWLVDVDGGTRMGDTETVVGPNTAYLPYEYHEGEDPIDPDPDRECYRTSNDYKYASAPDADQWLAVGLLLAKALTGQQTYEDLAHCLTSALKSGLTTARDFRQGIVDDFERDDLERWWEYAGGGASLHRAIVSPGAAGSEHALELTYQVPMMGYAGMGKSIKQDWSAYEGLRLFFRGEGTGNQMRVQLTDPRDNEDCEADDQEYFEYLITDEATGWRLIEIPFTVFTERTDWPPDYARTGNGVLDLDRIQSFALEPLKATFRESFEDGDSQGWWSYGVEGASIISQTISPGAEGTNYALQVTYDIATGYAGVGVSPNDDWSAFDDLTVYILGTNSGNDIRIELVERGDERWAHVISDTFLGWQGFSIPLEMSNEGFVKRYWQPPGADENGTLDRDRIKDVIFSPLPGWFSDDFEDGDVGDWWTYAGPDTNTTITRTIAHEGANETSKSMQVVYHIPPGGWAGTGKTVERDWRGYNGVQLWIKGENANARVRVQLEDADHERFEYILDLPAEWTPFSIPFSSFAYRSGDNSEDGNRQLDLNFIYAFVLEPLGPRDGVVYVDEVTVTGPDLGKGVFSLDELGLSGGPVRSGVGTAYVDEVELMGGPERQVYPNVMKFSLQWDQDGKIPWEGPLYTGYQDPGPYCLTGERAIASDIVTFLADAQRAYEAVDPEAANLGPFMPLFVQDPQYSKVPEIGWTWDGRAADSHTEWAQFQYRTFAHLAKYYFLSGDSQARVVLDNFHNWLKNHWQTEPATGTILLPRMMITETEQVELGYSPGDFGLAAQGLIYLAARTGETSYKADAEALLEDLVLHRQDEMGAFPNPEGFRFGYEQAEVGIALTLYELLLGEGGPDPVLSSLQCGEHRSYLPIILKKATFPPTLRATLIEGFEDISD